MSIKSEVLSFLQTTPVFQSSLPKDLNDDFPLIETGILDSIGIFSLVIFLEKKFALQIEIMDLTEENFGSLARIESFVRDKN